MSVCFARSLALSIGELILAAVRKAAKFAVYDEIKMRQKKYQSDASVRVDTALIDKKQDGGYSNNYITIADCGNFRLLHFRPGYTMIIPVDHRIFRTQVPKTLCLWTK